MQTHLTDLSDLLLIFLLTVQRVFFQRLYPFWRIGATAQGKGQPPQQRWHKLRLSRRDSPNPRENLPPEEWHFLGKRKVYGRCL